MRSYTGELLAPVLATDPHGPREVFDVEEAARKRKGDVDLRHVGKGSKMPWQVDGRRWHLEDRVAHNGKPARWEGRALALVIDTIEASEGFAPTCWTDRSVVEICPVAKDFGWFLHALTGEEWVLTLKFRVPKNTFREAELQSRLKLTDFNDLDEIPIYNRAERVRVATLKGPWQEVTITVHWLREIDTPAFREFLKTAIAAVTAPKKSGKADLADKLQKLLGKKWHLSRQGFPSNKRVLWDTSLLEALASTLESTAGVTCDWSGKALVQLRRSTEVWATIHTKRREGLDLTLYGPPGRFALGRISTLGAEREISRDNGRDAIRIRIVKPEHVEGSEFRTFLAEHVGRASDRGAIGQGIAEMQAGEGIPVEEARKLTRARTLARRT